MMNKMALALLLGTSAMCAFAQADQTKPITNGYNQNSQGDVTRSEFGLCWRSGSWTPNDAIAGCDGPLKPPIANPIAPDVANSLEKDVPVTVARCDFSITLAANQSFAFGQATLKKQASEKLVAALKEKLSSCQSVDGITVIGHTDAIGSMQTNQELSERRASAVANILRQAQIPGLIHTRGVGSTQPVTACPTTLTKAKRITCLAPDRRVEIHVNGPKK
ncbi:MAG: OmpA family protein [Oxalicibacterium faecigallinarum]|uniref:OmpA family protein n=1 Tax=Oxalicibacterium faecigallinarum TaxID=573741 RepID=UPI00280922EE|nr:OmpA family protein [Oxalicibacterium faecigallinarum]MDQ7968997.1 OmpA family protein [Oxalicibacterium faecigallinarum]